MGLPVTRWKWDYRVLNIGCMNSRECGNANTEIVLIDLNR